MSLSPSFLTVILSQPAIDAAMRRTLVDRFRFESPDWPLLDRVRLPETLAPTRDPVLLALRRLVRRDFAGLRPRHLAAAENAELLPFGLLHLVFEESVDLDPADLAPLRKAGDEGLRIFFQLLASSDKDDRHGWELFDLRARGVAEAVGRLAEVPETFVLPREQGQRRGPAIKAALHR